MAQVARPVGLKALAPDCHLASGELRLPLALGDQRLLAGGQPAAVGRPPARGRLRAPRRAHDDEPAAHLGVRVDTAVGLGEFHLQRDDLRRDLGLGQLGHLGPPFSTAFQRVRMEPARGTTETKRTRLLAGSFSYAPKRTRTSTRLSRTRPSTWRMRASLLPPRTIEPSSFARGTDQTDEPFRPFSKLFPTRVRNPPRLARHVSPVCRRRLRLQR